MIYIETIAGYTMSEQFLEIVERKGKGHPDTICDSIVESISIALAEEYKKRAGKILHFNIDKALLSAGKVEKSFGGGKVLKPIELIVGDRATFFIGNKKIPIQELIVETSRLWFKNNLRFFEPEKHLEVKLALSEGSVELSNIFKESTKILPANDTSAVVGFYPLTPAEKIVLELERYLNSENYKTLFPETGEDVKIMAVRRGDELNLTIAMPFIASLIYSEKEYFERKEKVLNSIKKFLRKYSGTFQINVQFNALDKKGLGSDGVYLSLLGTSLEDADSGQVGRGNRVNGLISVSRPLGTEAVAGKNPVSHVGKIYNVFAHQLAKKIHQKVEGIKEVYVYMVSTIGKPVNQPEVVSVKIIPEKGIRLMDISGKVTELVEKELADMAHFCELLSKGKFPIN
ncbi:MAG: methionine adenosyltransferase [Proteobacteria bacterium]|nr:methionine adenosyltransferase [Pseudomonadota bacterium]